MNISDIKKYMANKIHIIHNEIEYYITACIMRFRDNEWVYSLELHCLNANSITIADISKVELKTLDKL